MSGVSSKLNCMSVIIVPDDVENNIAQTVLVTSPSTSVVEAEVTTIVASERIER